MDRSSSPLTASGVSRRSISRAATLARCRVSFPEFFAELARDRNGRRVELGPIGELLIDTIESAWCAGKHVSIVAPPGLGKSTIARMYLIWLMGRDIYTNAAIISATEATAVDAVSLCRDMIARSESEAAEDEIVYRRVFPEVVPDYVRSTTQQKGARGWLKHAFFIQRGAAQAVDPALSAYTCKMTSAARRVDVGLFDDVMTPLIAAGAADREAMIRAFDQTWIEGRLVDRDRRGKAVVVGNCYNVDSLEHHLRKRPGWVSLWLGVNESLDGLRAEIVNCPDDHPANAAPEKYGARFDGVTDDGAKAWCLDLPEGTSEYSPAGLESKRANNPSLFSRVYQLRATRPEDMMFPSWDDRVRLDCRACDLVQGYMNERGELCIPAEYRETFAIALGVDVSSGKRPGDRIVAKARLRDGRRFVLEVRRGPWSPKQMADVITDMWDRFGFRVVMFESNAVQDKVRQGLMEIPESASWRHAMVAWTTTGADKADEEIGLPAMDVLIGNGAEVWCDGDLVAASLGEDGKVRGNRYCDELAELQREISNVPRLIPRGKTPDSMMAWWMADRGLARIGHGGGAMDVRGVGSSGRATGVGIRDMGF